jgi:hypothetical protein
MDGSGGHYPHHNHTERLSAGVHEPAAAKSRPSCMHGTLELTKLATARRRSVKARIIALFVLAGIVAGAVLVYTPLGDQLLTFLGFTDPKDCG